MQESCLCIPMLAAALSSPAAAVAVGHKGLLKPLCPTDHSIAGGTYFHTSHLISYQLPKVGQADWHNFETYIKQSLKGLQNM